MAQNLRAVGKSLLLPITTAAVTAGIFVADAITDLEIAFPVFYTAIVLLSVGFCKKKRHPICRRRMHCSDAAG